MDKNAKELSLPTEPPASGGAIGRRRFLTYMVAAPTLTVAVKMGLDVAVPGTAEALSMVPGIVDVGDALVLVAALTAYDLVIEITAANRVVVQLPRAEVGQGITTAVAMMVAEELDAQLADIDVVLSDADPANLFNQMTGSSNSVRALFTPVRVVAAAARARLVTAAAKKWNLPAGTLTTKNTKVYAPDGQSASYGSLTAAASTILLPAVSASPKDPSKFTVIGKPTNRIDAPALVTGAAKYALDLDIPGAKPTVVARPPTLRGTLVSYDASVASKMPGVLAITPVQTGVAVIAETFDQALKARAALQTTWNDGPIADLSDSGIRKILANAVPPLTVPGLLTLYTDATFEFAFVSHAPMEVLAAVADVRHNDAEVWFASKTPIVAQEKIAAAIGLPQDAVTVHVIRGGGSFGRRLFFDAGLEAARISKASGMPIKLMWSRDDDMRHGRMRPATHHRVRATHALGAVLTYEHRVAAVQTDFDHGLGEALTAAGFDLLGTATSQVVFALTETVPYNFGVVTQLLAEVPLNMPTGSWRSVYSGVVSVANEIMVDELARKFGKDPVAYRKSMLQSARAKAVLDKVALAGKWGSALPPGKAQGVGIHEEFNSAVACLVEIDTTDHVKGPRVTKAFVAVDVGHTINPRGLEAQIMSATVDGISLTLSAGLHIDNGAVREGSFSDFKYARMRNTPLHFEVHILPPTGSPGGAGELAVPAAAAAVANAYARATGKSPRRFPISG